MTGSRSPQCLSASPISRRSLLLGSAAMASTLLPPCEGAAWIEAFFAPKPDLWARWQAHDPADATQIDHADWDAFLKRYVIRDPNGLNRVAYAAVVPADRARLDGYVSRLSQAPVSALARDEQRAYWINLYNALTLQVVLAHYPVASIRDIDISPGFLSDGPWDKKLVVVEGEKVSLNDIEHRILRPIWNDPRIHYAVNCASVGCPNLQRDAFTAANTEALLEAGAKAYVNSPRGVVVRDSGLVVSSIYIWFQRDFGGSDNGVIAHLGQYAGEALAERIRRADRIADHAYDWALNDSKPR